MFKKSVFIATVGVACIGISSMSYAASFAGWDKMIMPPSTRRQPVNYRYPYIRVGVGGYYVRNPKVEIGTLSDTSPLATIGTSKLTPRFNLAVGYAFYNQNTSWVTKIFGHDNAVELKLDYLNSKEHKTNSNLGVGQVWFIDGSGTVTAGAQPLTSFKLDSSHRYINTGLYYKGKWITSNPKIDFLPRVGAVFTNLREKYDYSLVYQSFVLTTDVENYKITTDYYGLAAGGRLACNVKPRCAVFGDIEAQLLRASSSLKAYQNAAVGVPGNQRNVSYHHAKITYRAIAAVGGEYKLNNKITSPSVEIKGGIDRWGYDPHLVPPNNAGSRSVYVAGNAQNNLFADVEVTVPIG